MLRSSLLHPGREKARMRVPGYDGAMFAGGSAVARVWLMFVGLSLVVASSASPAGARHADALTVSSAVASAHWKEGWLLPGANVRFTGSVDAASSLTAALRPLDRPGTVTARTTFEVAGAGPFSRQLRLPPRPLPGTYSLRLGGTSGAARLEPVDVTVTIPAPPEGVLDRAEVGTTPSGPWSLYKTGTPPIVHGSHKELWMRFRFLYPPTGKNIELVWKLHWHRVVGRVYKLYKDTLTTSVASGAPLPSGHWSAVLMIDGRVAKKMDVVVT
jgi:hypothetical protein